jgi:hypothetical protein
LSRSRPFRKWDWKWESELPPVNCFSFDWFKNVWNWSWCWYLERITARLDKVNKIQSRCLEAETARRNQGTLRELSPQSVRMYRAPARKPRNLPHGLPLSSHAFCRHAFSLFSALQHSRTFSCGQRYQSMLY